MTISETSTEILHVRRSSRELDALIRRLRRGNADAHLEFRERQLSRRRRVAERRRDMRQPLHVPVYLTPCFVQGNKTVCTGEPIMGVTRDVSDDGVGLSFDHRIEASHVIAEFDIFGHGPVMLLVELRWVEKKSSHAYVGGGLWQGLVDFEERSDD